MQELPKKNLTDNNNTEADVSFSSSKNSGPSEKPTNKKKNHYLLYMSIILIITALVLYFSLKDNFFDVIDTFKNIDGANLAYGILCFVVSFMIDCLILFLFARRYKHSYYYHQAVANGMIGNFYNGVTPSQSGGQIMQAYTFKKQGISISNATSCLVMNFIVYQCVLILFGIFSISTRFSQIFEIEGIVISFNSAFTINIPMWLLTIIGFFLDFTIIGVTLLMSYSKHFHRFILNSGVNFFAKLHIVKNPEESRRKLAISVESFKLELKNLLTNPIFLLVIFLLTVASFILKFIVPYFVGKAVMGATPLYDYQYSVIDCISYAGFQKLVAELIPVPGGAGISEFIYTRLFTGAYSAQYQAEQISAFISSAQIIWRCITFHFPLIITGFVSAFYKSRSKEDYADVSSTTYVDLQMETISERRTNYETMTATRTLNRQEVDKKRKDKKSSIFGKKNNTKDE